jgi:hypothetical protein
LGIERDLARDHPDLAAASIDAIARASRAGRRGLDAARTPTDADLARVLAAWLADVPARSVFSSWEMRLIDARIARGRDPSVEAKWTALRSQLSNVDDTRIVAPLILIKDPKSNLIGFNRIVLPRRRGAAVPLEDVVPGRPLGLLLVDRVGSSPSVCRRLLAGGYRTISIVEEPALPLWRSSFGDPFRSARVTVTLESPGATARVVLEGEVHTDDAGTVTIARPTRSVTGDPELAELLRD